MVQSSLNVTNPRVSWKSVCYAEGFATRSRDREWTSRIIVSEEAHTVVAFIIIMAHSTRVSMMSAQTFATNTNSTSLMEAHTLTTLRRTAHAPASPETSSRILAAKHKRQSESPKYQTKKRLRWTTGTLTQRESGTAWLGNNTISMCAQTPWNLFHTKA